MKRLNAEAPGADVVGTLERPDGPPRPVAFGDRRMTAYARRLLLPAWLRNAARIAIAAGSRGKREETPWLLH